MAKITGTLTGKYTFQWQEKNTQGQWITKSETTDAILSFTISDLKFDLKTPRGAYNGRGFNGIISGLTNKLKYLDNNLKVKESSFEFKGLPVGNVIDTENIFTAGKGWNGNPDYTIIPNSFITTTIWIDNKRQPQNNYIRIISSELDLINNKVTLSLLCNLFDNELRGTITGEYEEINEDKEVVQQQQQLEEQQKQEELQQQTPIESQNKIESTPSSSGINKGPREYQESLLQLSTTKQAGEELKTFIEQKNTEFENGNYTEIKEDELSKISDKANINIKEVPSDKKYTDRLTVPNDIRNGESLLTDLSNIADPFLNSTKGLGTFGDLEKLLSFSGGILNVISLLSKFFKLDLSTIENINDIGGNNTTVNQLAPGTTEQLLDTVMPMKNITIPPFPKITEANENIPGSTQANNLATQLKNKHAEKATNVQMNYGKTSNERKMPAFKQEIKLEQYKPIENKLKIGGLEQLLSYKAQKIEGAENKAMESKIEGSLNLMNPIQSGQIVASSMALTLNLTFNKTNKTLKGGASMIVKDKNNANYQGKYSNKDVNFICNSSGGQYNTILWTTEGSLTLNAESETEIGKKTFILPITGGFNGSFMGNPLPTQNKGMLNLISKSTAIEFLISGSNEIIKVKGNYIEE